MHAEVLSWVSESLRWWGCDESRKVSVLEFGSLDINGSVRSILEPISDNYLGIDANYGKGVDIIADASVFKHSDLFDIVVCCEVFEHTALWPSIIKNAYANLNYGGLFICTMAGVGRPPHSALDENPVRDWEHYQNVDETQLSSQLAIFATFQTDVINQDTRGRAIKRAQ